MEGEELPIDMLGPRIRRKRIHLHWPHLPGFHSQQQAQSSEVHVTDDLEHQPRPPPQQVGPAVQPQ